MLSIHIPALLPLASAEIEVAPMVQTAAIVAVGLLYQGTQHRRITEVLLAEIGKPPVFGNVNFDREAYCLTAGNVIVERSRGSYW